MSSQRSSIVTDRQTDAQTEDNGRLGIRKAPLLAELKIHTPYQWLILRKLFQSHLPMNLVPVPNGKGYNEIEIIYRCQIDWRFP